MSDTNSETLELEGGSPLSEAQGQTPLSLDGGGPPPFKRDRGRQKERDGLRFKNRQQKFVPRPRPEPVVVSKPEPVSTPLPEPVSTPVPEPTAEVEPEPVTESAQESTQDPTPEPEENQGLRLSRRNYNQEIRQRIDESSSVLKPNITQILNILGDTYNLTPNKNAINIKGSPKSLVTFVTNYGINPDYNVDVPMTIKAFYNVFDDNGEPKESFDTLMHKPAYHFICNHMMYRMVTLKMEIQLQNRSSLRRGELEQMYEKFDDFMKKGKCGAISKAAAQEAFEREEKNLLVSTGSGTSMVTQGLENKLNYIIAILNKFIEDGMRERLKQLQVNGFDCGIMENTLKQFMDTTDMPIDTMIQKYLDVGVPSGGLKVCLGQMKMQAEDTGNIGILIQLLKGMKSGTELSERELDELGEALGKADLEVGRKAEFKSLRDELLRLKTVVEKGKCTSCAEEVEESDLPVASSVAPSRSPSPIASKLPIGAPSSLKEEHEPGSVGIGSTDISPDADKNPEDNPSAIPIPFFNAFISSLHVEGDKPLIAFKNLDAMKSKINELQLDNTDLYFIDKSVGFKLLVPPNNQFFKTKFNPNEVINLGPMPIEGLTKQIKVNVFPLKYNGKYHTFLLVPKDSVKKETSPASESPASESPASESPAIPEQTDVEKTPILTPTPIFEDQVLQREATPLSRGTTKPAAITQIADSESPVVIDYRVFDKNGNPIMITPKSDPMKKEIREPIQLTINPKFVLPELQVVDGIGITLPVLIHKSGVPFIPKNGTLTGYIIKKNSSQITGFDTAKYGPGDKYIWISEKDPEYVSKSPVIPTTTPATPTATATPTPAVTPTVTASPTASPQIEIVATSSPTTTSISDEKPGTKTEKLLSENRFTKKILDEIIDEANKPSADDDWKKLEEYFNIPDNQKQTIRNTDPLRIGLYNAIKYRYKIPNSMYQSMRDDIKVAFGNKLGSRISKSDEAFFEGIYIQPEDKATIEPIIKKINEEVKTKPFITEIKGLDEDQKTRLSRYSPYLTGIVQPSVFGTKKGGYSSNRIRYTRKRAHHN